MKTNDKKIRDAAVDFLNFDIKPTDIEFLVYHPFFSYVNHPVGKEYVNLLEEDGAERARNAMEKMIRESSTERIMLVLIRNVYRLAFFKYVEDQLSKEDFSRYLPEIFSQSEFPSTDGFASLEDIKDWFMRADKKYMMNKSEYDIYTQLPEKVTVYRGATTKKAYRGLSWTTDKNKALWYANRFSREERYLFTAEICKKDILTYIGRRNEKEIVCQPVKYTVERLL